jgi:hypothetical protein
MTREEMISELTLDELYWFVGYVEDCGSDFKGRELAIKEMAAFIAKGGFNFYDDEKLKHEWTIKCTDNYPEGAEA